MAATRLSFVQLLYRRPPLRVVEDVGVVADLVDAADELVGGDAFDLGVVYLRSDG